MGDDTCPMTFQDMLELHRKISVIENDLALIKPKILSMHEQALVKSGEVNAGNGVKLSLAGVVGLLAGTNSSELFMAVTKMLGNL